MQIEDLPEPARTWVASFNEQNTEAMMELLADGGTFDDPVTDEPASGDELRGYIAETYEAFPDVRIDPVECYETEDAIVMEVEYSGTFEGVPPTGVHGQIDAAIVMRVGDDGIEAAREYWDGEEFREALGLSFPEILSHAPRLVAGKLKSFA